MHIIGKFKVGDRVRIVKVINSYSTGWTNSWSKLMDSMVNNGLTYSIVDDVGSAGLRLTGLNLCWPSEALVLDETGQNVLLTELKGESSMGIKIETGVTLIDGVNASDKTDEQIFGIINRLEEENANYNKTTNQPEKLKAKVAKNLADIKTLISIVDGRP